MRSPLRLETRALASSSCTMVQHFTWSLTVQGRCRMRLARSLQDPVIAWPKAFRNRYDGLAERVLHRRWLRAPDPGRHLFHLSGNVGARAKATVSSYLWKSRFDATHLRTGSRNCVFSKALQRTPIFQRGACPRGRFKSAAAQTSFRTEEEFHPHGGALSMIEMPEVRRVHCVRR